MSCSYIKFKIERGEKVMEKIRLITITLFVLSCLAFASPAHANFLGLSPEASEFFIVFFFVCAGIIFAICLIVQFVQWVIKKIKG